MSYIKVQLFVFFNVCSIVMPYLIALVRNVIYLRLHLSLFSWSPIDGSILIWIFDVLFLWCPVTWLVQAVWLCFGRCRFNCGRGISRIYTCFSLFLPFCGIVWKRVLGSKVNRLKGLRVKLNFWILTHEN